MNAKRQKEDVQEAHTSTVHRFCRSLTHKSGVTETRGRKSVLSRRDILRLDQSRRWLIRRADNDFRVTFAEVIKEAGLEGVASQRVCEDALRDLGVSFKHPRRKIYITEKDVKKRHAWAKTLEAACQVLGEGYKGVRR